MACSGIPSLSLSLSPAVRVSVDFFLASLLRLRRIRLHNVRKFIIVIILTVSREKVEVADEHGILRVPFLLISCVNRRGVPLSCVSQDFVHSSQILIDKDKHLPGMLWHFS